MTKRKDPATLKPRGRKSHQANDVSVWVVVKLRLSEKKHSALRAISFVAEDRRRASSYKSTDNAERKAFYRVEARRRSDPKFAASLDRFLLQALEIKRDAGPGARAIPLRLSSKV